MSTTYHALLLAVVLLASIVGATEVGRRLGIRRSKRDAEGSRAGLGAIEGAIFALLGLLIAFSFSGAAARFDNRRMLIVQEANDIGTAYLRIDLLPAAAQPAIRDLFRKYLDLRLALYQSLAKHDQDPEAVRLISEAVEVQQVLWSLAVRESQVAGPPVAQLLLPTLNSMFDTCSLRIASIRLHPPRPVFFMLLGLTLLAAVLAGFGMAGAQKRSWLHIFGFAVIMASTVYLIVDLEYPRRGLIRVDASDQLLVDLRRGMEPRP
ncbi:MAG: DUF4239 domain-containing protein [Verrucomicrobia bacterium]|nr:DUF4239 domain-containing protein [Verrucomicrobiota bacterium]